MTSIANFFKTSAFLVSLIAVPAAADEALVSTASSYDHVVFSRISQHAIYPHQAERRDEQGVVTLVVTVDKTGNVADLRLLSSSGIAEIDHAALQAALSAAPYPKPAADLAEVKGRIRFSL